MIVWIEPGLFDSLSALGAYWLSYLNWWNLLEENKEKNDLVQKDLPQKKEKNLFLNKNWLFGPS